MAAAAPIRSQVYAPNPRLASYVSAYLTTAIDVATDQHTIDLCPVGYPVLSFALDDLPLVFDEAQPVQSKFCLTGQLTRYHRLTVGGQYCYAYVLFKPFGAWRLLGFRQDQLVDTFGYVRDLAPGPPTERAYEQLIQVSVARVEEAIPVLENWLLTLLNASPRRPEPSAVARACELIEASAGAISMEELRAAVGLSEGSLLRQFRERVGLPPKRYARVVRFIAAYRTIQQEGPQYTDWDALVRRYQYFDQAHFIKEFRAFFGYTPAQVHRSVLNIADHVLNTNS